MNELDMIRTLLDEAPPSAEVVGEGRRRIAAAGTAPQRPGSQRLRPWHLRARRVRPVVGLAAAALAGAVAITLVATMGSPGRRGGTPPPTAGTLTATELAYRAAAAAARQPAVPPGQWVYRKYLTKYLTKDFTSRTMQFWTTADSLRAAWTSAGGKVHFFGGLASLGMTAVPVKKVHGEWALLGFGQLPVSYAHLGSLPHQPKALDRYLASLLSSAVGPASDREFLAIQTMLTAYAMPPALTAEFYRALGDIPGIRVDTHAVDVAGRHGVAFMPGKPVALGATPEIIVNPRTYRLMAVEALVPRSASVAAGAEGTAILQEALVSGPGVMP